LAKNCAVFGIKPLNLVRIRNRDSAMLSANELYQQLACSERIRFTELSEFHNENCIKLFCWGDALRISATPLHRRKLQCLNYRLLKPHHRRGLFLLKLYHNVTDRETDRQTVSDIPITALSRADARQ